MGVLRSSGITSANDLATALNKRQVATAKPGAAPGRPAAS
jgi:hypothetical protein